MHSYSVDSDERKNIPFYIAAVAIVATWFFYTGLQKVNINIPNWVDAPSAMGFYAIFYWLFNNYIWRFSWFNTFGIIKTPSIAGIWTGALSSSHGESKVVEITIIQSWTEISILLKTDTSRSHSIVASLALNTPSGATLHYEYQSDPLPGAPSAMQVHYGTAQLVLGGNVLSGEYYSGRGRQNIGTLNVKKTP